MANDSYSLIKSRMLSDAERAELVDSVIDVDFLGDTADDVLESSGGLYCAYIVGTTVLKYDYRRGFYAAEQFSTYQDAFKDAREYIG